MQCNIKAPQKLLRYEPLYVTPGELRGNKRPKSMIFLRLCMFSKGIIEYHQADESVTWMLICRFTDHWCHHKGTCGSINFGIHVLSFSFI